MSTAIKMGTHRGLSLMEAGVGGVYRADADGWCSGLGVGREPGVVPFGVTRPDVVLLGGGTGRESTL